MKKSSAILILLFLALSIEAAFLPSYDFTFYTTADETLTSFTKENVGIDVTGYGFVGKTAERGIYLRLGIQTPFETLIKLKDELFGNGNEEKTGDDALSPLSGESFTERSSNQTIRENLPSGDADEARKKADIISPSEWKFLLTLGPAYRRMMGENAMVYLGLGISVSGDYINDFTYENGDYYASFFALLGTDVDAGFRVGMRNSSTTIRVGVHFMTDIAGYSSLKVYGKDRIVTAKETDIYGYIAGKKGIAAAMTGRGYVRLAKTINEKRKVRYNYFNTTGKIGGGEIETVVL